MNPGYKHAGSTTVVAFVRPVKVCGFVFAICQCASNYTGKPRGVNVTSRTFGG